jgi:hypothetical protein
MLSARLCATIAIGSAQRGYIYDSSRAQMMIVSAAQVQQSLKYYLLSLSHSSCSEARAPRVSGIGPSKLALYRCSTYNTAQ